MKTAATVTQTFGRVAGDPLFSVNAGVPIPEALERAAELLCCLKALTTSAASGTCQGGEIEAIQFLTEMASGLVCACANGAEAAERRL